MKPTDVQRPKLQRSIAMSSDGSFKGFVIPMKPTTNKNHKGTVLLTTLVITLLLVMLGQSVVHQSIINEKTNQNYRDYTRAFFSAESALAVAEQSIQNTPSLDELELIRYGASTPAVEVVAMNCSRDWWLGVVPSCANLSGTVHVVSSDVMQESSSVNSPSYMIEHFGFSPDSLNQGESAIGTNGVHHFRILARGTGQAVDERGESLTTVFLQSIYSRAF